MNKKLNQAQRIIQDDFYTQYKDIKNEIDQYVSHNPSVFNNKTILLPCDDPERSHFVTYFIDNFDKFGLKKIISTSYAKSLTSNNNEHGKILIIERNRSNNKCRKNWQYLDSDGDFRSKEIQRICHESDMIITNPPFSLFHEFLAWIMNNKKQFIIVSNKNCFTNRNTFNYFKNNQLWHGYTKPNGGMYFETMHDDFDMIIDNKKMKSVSAIWLTNIKHDKQPPILLLKTMKENKQQNPSLTELYEEYNNFYAIEVSKTKLIPNDFDGVMGVPISFLDKCVANPSQFEIIDLDSNIKYTHPELIKPDWIGRNDKVFLNGKCKYARVFIKLKSEHN